MLDHKAHLEGGRCHFLSLRPKQDVENTNLMLGKHNHEYIDPNTKKVYWINEFVDYVSFLDKQKLASHLFLLAPVCYGGHWWLWITDVKKKVFHVFDSVKKKDIPEERIVLNKCVEEVDAFRRKYGPTIPLDKVNKLRDKVIEASEAIRIPNLSAALSSHFCKFSSRDIESK
ncbi:hypothetical protein AHAS_Ahas19G0220600 [Arachis hypogaea]